MKTITTELPPRWWLNPWTLARDLHTACRAMQEQGEKDEKSMAFEIRCRGGWKARAEMAEKERNELKAYAVKVEAEVKAAIASREEWQEYAEDHKRKTLLVEEKLAFTVRRAEKAEKDREEAKAELDKVKADFKAGEERFNHNLKAAQEIASELDGLKKWVAARLTLARKRKPSKKNGGRK